MSEITMPRQRADHQWRAEPRSTALDDHPSGSDFCCHYVDVDQQRVCILNQSQHPSGPGFIYEVRVPATLNRERRAEQAMVLILRGNAEQVTDFLNRPGDYYDRTFQITTVPPETPKGFLGDPEPDEQSDTETISANMAAMAGHAEPTPRFEVRRSDTARPGLHYVFDAQYQRVVRDWPSYGQAKAHADMLNRAAQTPRGTEKERRAGPIDLDELAEAITRFESVWTPVGALGPSSARLVLRAAKAFLALDRAGLIKGRRNRS